MEKYCYGKGWMSPSSMARTPAVGSPGSPSSPMASGACSSASSRALRRCNSTGSWQLEATQAAQLGCWSNGVSGGSPRSVLSPARVASASGRTQQQQQEWWAPGAVVRQVKAIQAPPSRAKPAVKQPSPQPDRGERKAVTAAAAPAAAPPAPPATRSDPVEGGASAKPAVRPPPQDHGTVLSPDQAASDAAAAVLEKTRKKQQQQQQLARTKSTKDRTRDGGDGDTGTTLDIDKTPKESNAFWDYQFLFKSQRLEVATPIRLEVVQGKVPVDLAGAYYLCGPGIFTDDHGSSIHPLDGHGYLRKFSVQQGAVHYSARYIDTEARQAEYDESSEEWKFVYRGPFSVLKGGSRWGNAKVMKNTANTSVLKWGRKLLCFWEGGQPYEMDPASLDTMGLYSMTEGAVSTPTPAPATAMTAPAPPPSPASDLEPTPVVARLQSLAAQVERVWESANTAVTTTVASTATMSPGEVAMALHIAGVSLTAKLLQPVLNGVYAMPEERALAHVKVDSKRQRLVVITCRAEDMILPISTFSVYEFDEELELQQRREFVLPHQLMVHDWGITDNFYILVANRVKLSPTGCVGALAGVSPMIAAIATDDSLPFTPVFLLPRTPGAGGGRDWRVPCRIPRQWWLLHTANSYEEEEVVDADGRGSGRVRIVLDGSFCSYTWFSLNNMFGYRWQKRRLDHAFMNSTNPAHNEAAHLARIHFTLPATSNSSSSSSSAAAGVSVIATDDHKDDGVTVDDVQVRVQEYRAGSMPACDFPCVNPLTAGRRHRVVYVAASSGHRSELLNFPFDCVVKMADGPAGRTAFWWAGDRSFVGEPVFVPRTGGCADPDSPDFREDNGYLVVVQYCAAEKTCYLVVLDAQKIGKRDPVVARLRVPKDYAFPMGFHGFWDDQPQTSSSS